MAALAGSRLWVGRAERDLKANLDPGRVRPQGDLACVEAPAPEPPAFLCCAPCRPVSSAAGPDVDPSLVRAVA